jgi:hypothetical protein
MELHLASKTVFSPRCSSTCSCVPADPRAFGLDWFVAVLVVWAFHVRIFIVYGAIRIRQQIMSTVNIRVGAVKGQILAEARKEE